MLMTSGSDTYSAFPRLSAFSARISLKDLPERITPHRKLIRSMVKERSSPSPCSGRSGVHRSDPVVTKTVPERTPGESRVYGKPRQGLAGLHCSTTTLSLQVVGLTPVAPDIHPRGPQERRHEQRLMARAYGASLRLGVENSLHGCSNSRLAGLGDFHHLRVICRRSVTK